MHKLTHIGIGLLIGAWTWLSDTSAALSEEVEGPVSALSGSITLGYDSRYVLYGSRLSRHLWHAAAYLNYPLSDNTSVWGGSWVGYLTDGTYREVDGFVGIDYGFPDWLTIGAAYSLFYFNKVPFDASNQSHEIAVHATAGFGAWFLSLRPGYDTDADGYLVRGIGGYGAALTERIGLQLSAEAGYALRYFSPGNNWNHALITAKVPLAVTEATTLTPFISRSIPLTAIKAFATYETVWGVSYRIGF